MLIEKIKEDRLEAFKNKENIKQNLLTNIINVSKEIEKFPSDVTVLSVIETFINDARTVQDNSNERDYTFFEATREIEILSSYKSGGSGLP